MKWVAVLVLCCVAVDAAAQVFVYPRRANKSLVRYDEFDWLHLDILVGAEADKLEGGAIRRPPGMPNIPGTPEGTDGPQGTPLKQMNGWTRSHGPWAPDGIRQALQFTQTDPASAQTNPTPPLSPAPTQPPGSDASPDNNDDDGDRDDDIDDIHVTDSTVVGPPAPSTGVKSSLKRSAWERELGPGAGGVRLYFYESERGVAERAVPLITNAYRYLVEQFDYVPTRTFPYILYNTYQEYLQTNLFPLSEGTLGVTSPVDLKLTLPYFGDAHFFDMVSTHELAHQFTIQKVKTRAEQEKTSDPLMGLPLWFIEGLAEFYAQRGMDAETEMLVRDLLVNPSFEQGYVLQDFFAEGPYGFLWIYKMGQARCAFLEETYGAGTLQRILEQSPSTVGSGGFGLAAAAPVKGEGGFPGLLRRVTKDSPRAISAKFEAWLKRRGFTSYLGTTQNGTELEPLENVDGIPDALASSPDGTLVMFRTIEPETGQSRISLMDPRDPDSRTTVVVDGVPGVESLHVVFGRNFAVREEKLVYVAEDKGRDVLYVQEVRHRAEKGETPKPPPLAPPPANGTLADPRVFGATRAMARPMEPVQTDLVPWWKVDVDLGKRHVIRLNTAGILALYSPAFSPDGKRIAFVGLNRDGNRDLYLVDADAKGEVTPVRLTNDTHAEKQVTWGPGGIVFTSDNTSHGKQNLFRIAPEPGAAPTRLTTAARNDQDPLALSDGRILYVAYDQGKADVYEWSDGTITRRTDFGTGLFDLGVGLDGGLWALLHEQGRRRPVKLPKDKLLALEKFEPTPGGSAEPLQTVGLDAARHYDASLVKNWEMGPIFGLIGGGTGGIAGQVFATATDRLRNHALLLQGSVFGSFQYSDGVLAYLNQENRVAWGGGLFQSLRFRVDQTQLPDDGLPFLFVSAERFYGVLGTARYPFNRFVYVQADASVGGTNYFLGGRERFLLADTYFSPSGNRFIDAWNAANGGTRFQSEAAVSLGFDTLRYHYATGPIDGSSVLFQLAGGVQPFNSQAFGSARLDAERYFPLLGRANLLFRLGSGTAFGGQYARQFYLSSFDTLRGVRFGDVNWLLGRNYLYSTAELQIPLNALIRFLLLSDVEGIAGFDIGSVSNEFDEMWTRRVAAAVVGFNFSLGPILFRLHFAKPVLIGKGAISPTPNAEWVTNFSIGLAGLGGFYGKTMPNELRPEFPMR